MITKLLRILAITLSFAANVDAATMTITGPSSATVGSSFQLQIWGDFTGVGLGAGGIDFLWDASLVRLDEVTLELEFTHPANSCPGAAACPPDGVGVSTIIWGVPGSIGVIGPADPAPVLMATLDFTAIGTGADATALFSMITSDITGGWFAPGFSVIPTPDFAGWQMTIVPLPAGVWLMLGGLGTLIGLRRRA